MSAEQEKMQSEISDGALIEWKDISSFSRGDTDRTPNAFEFRVGPLRTVITRGHIYFPHGWVVTVMTEGRGPMELGPKTLSADKAKALAEDVTRKYVAALAPLSAPDEKGLANPEGDASLSEKEIEHGN